MFTLSSTVFAGAGIGYRRQYHQALLSHDSDPKPDVLEIIPSHLFSEPEKLSPLAERYTLVFHEVGTSIATAKSLDDPILERTRELMQYGRPILFSEHLAMTFSPEGVDLGHLAPVWYTLESLELIAERIHRRQDFLSVPVALENIAAPFEIPEADFTEPEFFRELIKRTGCGLLMDVTNILMNSRNFGYDPFVKISEYPTESIWQVHLAGGKKHKNWWVDSHSEPLEQQSLELLATLRGKAPLKAAIVERDVSLPPLQALVSEAQAVAQIWLRND